MKKHLVALSIALSLALTADAKTFTWASSLDALSMDPYSTNNTFTNQFMSNIYEGWCASTRRCRSSQRWRSHGNR
jgi:peptide/nickel transport system substrate-binding protein